MKNLIEKLTWEFYFVMKMENGKFMISKLKDIIVGVQQYQIIKHLLSLIKLDQEELILK